MGLRQPVFLVAEVRDDAQLAAQGPVRSPVKTAPLPDRSPKVDSYLPVTVLVPPVVGMRRTKVPLELPVAQLPGPWV
jgi:hypothetical protein